MKNFLSICFLLSIFFAGFPRDWESLWTGKQFSQYSRWISMQANDTEENQWIIFRKNYLLESLPQESVIAKIAVDSKYWLYINGQPVVFEGQLKRGPTPDDTYYDEVDISPYLQTGENSIAVLVWFWGRDGYCHNNSGKAGLFFEAVTSEISWISNSSWKYAHHTAFGATDDPQPNHRLPEFNIRYTTDASLENWMMPEFDDTSWEQAVEIGLAGSPPWNNGLAVVAGLADTGKWPHIRALFDTTFHAGPYLEKYILESYFIMNDAEKGIQRMKKRYRMMVESPLTTLWEGWEIGSHTHGGGSYNHGWSGGPLTLMSQYIAGVQPRNDGFETVLIKPKMGGLKRIECAVPHRKGIIRVHLEQKSGALQAQITLPAGLTGTLVWNNQNRNLHEGFQEVKLIGQ